MPVEIQRRYNFDAAHRLEGLEPEHPCARLHGHRFCVDVVLRGDVDSRGMVCDFRELDRRLKPLIERLDHAYLNEIEGLSQPTVENLAVWFARHLPELPAPIG